MSEKTKQGKYSAPVWDFKPTDTIIIPDSFWEVMKNLYDIKTLHKVVLCMGYSGLNTIEPGINWGTIGFTDVICMSENVMNDYKEMWPHLNYYLVGYPINFDKLKPINKLEQKPIIGLDCRSREDAQMIINLFYAKYPFLDLFQFKVLKKMDTASYMESIRQCACIVFVDEKAGYPAPPVEAIVADVPVIAVYGRGMKHLEKQEGITWLSTNDNFLIVDELAGFCLNWLENIPQEIQDKQVTVSFELPVVTTNLLTSMDVFQEYKIKLFTAIKSAVDEGKLSDHQLGIN